MIFTLGSLAYYNREEAVVYIREIYQHMNSIIKLNIVDLYQLCYVFAFFLTQSSFSTGLQCKNMTVRTDTCQLKNSMIRVKYNEIELLLKLNGLA